jgi:hypothetical protein
MPASFGSPLKAQQAWVRCGLPARRWRQDTLGNQGAYRVVRADAGAEDSGSPLALVSRCDVGAAELAVSGVRYELLGRLTSTEHCKEGRSMYEDAAVTYIAIYDWLATS